MAEDLISSASQAMSSLANQALGFLVEQIGPVLGGNLEKARLIPVSPKADHAPIQDGTLEAFEFMFNPAKIKWTNAIRWTRRPDQATHSAGKTYGGSEGRKLVLNDIWFDTFESRENVRTKYIDKLERFSMPHKEGDHAPPNLRFEWGKFTGKANANTLPIFVLEALDVEYTMFLADGTPVRAKVTISLREATPPTEQQQPANKSPDHAKLVTVRRGDTLQAIAYKEYDTPAEWRRIAEANNIDDPMRLEPGAKLLVPPILK